MKVWEIEQNTEEWLEWRKGKSGGSEIKDLWVSGLPLKSDMINALGGGEDIKKLSAEELAKKISPETMAELKLGRKPKKHYYEMLAERVARPLTPNDYIDRLNGKPFSMMERGHILEPEIAARFEQVTGLTLDAKSVVWESDYSPYAYISPDRTITSEDGKVRTAVEIKALDSPKVLEIWKTGDIPDEYMPQIVKYFTVNDDLEVLYWVVGTDLIPGLEIQIFRIPRSDVEDKIEELKAFEIGVLSMLEKDAEAIESIPY